LSRVTFVAHISILVKFVTRHAICDDSSWAILSVGWAVDTVSAGLVVELRFQAILLTERTSGIKTVSLIAAAGLGRETVLGHVTDSCVLGASQTGLIAGIPIRARSTVDVTDVVDGINRLASGATTDTHNSVSEGAASGCAWARGASLLRSVIILG
jgi:hypothetical protein